LLKGCPSGGKHFLSLKILILKPSSLGDVIQALPVLRLLKKSDSSHQIHWWIHQGLRGLLEEDPDLDGLIPFHRSQWGNPRYWPQLYQQLEEIRQCRFDWVIDLQGLARSGVFSWFAKGGFTIGVEDPREFSYVFYDVAVPRPSYDSHAVDWYLAVLKQLGVSVDSDFEWIPPRIRAAEAVQCSFSDSAFSSVDPIAICPGARWSNKQWPAEYWRRLLEILISHADCMDREFVILGGKDEQALGQSLVQLFPQRVRDMTGRTSLPELIEWLRISRVIVCNDSGPMHIAAALKKNLVALFGPTHPARTGPYGGMNDVQRIKIPCAPCMKSTCLNSIDRECLTLITPEWIAEQVVLRLET
jgi:lipopolysaccharide heptosyltransferase II